LSFNTPFRVEEIRLDPGDRYPLTVGADRMPEWWPNLYCTIALRSSGLAFSTMQARMSAICLFHNLCSDMGIDVTARIESLELFRSEELEALRDELRISLRNSEAHGRNSEAETVINAHWKNRLIAISDYIVWRATPTLDRMSLRDPGLREARYRVERLIGIIKVRGDASKEGMDEATRKAFLDAITPGNPTNPFRKRNQVRNQALWMLYYDGGLRRSEALVLACRDLNLNGDTPYAFVPRRPDDTDDPRAREPRTKTLAHRAWLSPETAMLLSDYVINDRLTYPGAKKSKYVFLSQKGTTQKAQPLTISAVVAMYERLREKVPGLPEDFSTHMVRRTFNDRLGEAAEELGLNDDTEQQVANAQGGWTRGSQTRLKYKRRQLRKTGNKIGVKMQEKTKKLLENG
jgi:integrase